MIQIIIYIVSVVAVGVLVGVLSERFGHDKGYEEGYEVGYKFGEDKGIAKGKDEAINNHIKKPTGVIECKYCGEYNKLLPGDVYIVKDNASIVNAFNGVKKYDVFDCYKCGCQNVVTERKDKVEVDTNLLEE